MRRIVAAAAIALATPALATPAGADTLVDNVDGFTLTADGRIQRFTGLLVGNDGRVEQIFQRGDKRPARADYRLDGKGRVLMPGLVDAHLDLMALGLTLLGPASDKARPRPEDRDDALTKAQQFLLERGVTTVTDMGTTIAAWQAYRRAGDYGRLSIRIIGYAASVEDMTLIGGPGPTPWLYDDRLRLNGLRIAFSAPPPPAPGQRPATAAATAREAQAAIQLKNLLSRASIDGFQSVVDLADARAVPPVLDAIAEMQQTYKGDRRWRIDLPVAPDAADLPRLAQLGVSITMVPPPGAAVPAIPVPAGPDTPPPLRYGLGSGAPAGRIEPFPVLAAALPREGALAGMTTGAAWSSQAEGRVGRIAIGQKADFLLVASDPLMAASSELRGFKVLQTWIGGRIVWQAPEEAPAPASVAR